MRVDVRKLHSIVGGTPVPLELPCRECGRTAAFFDSAEAAIARRACDFDWTYGSDYAWTDALVKEHDTRWGEEVELRTKWFLDEGALTPFSSHDFNMLRWNRLEHAPFCRPRVELRRLTLLVLLINRRLSTRRPRADGAIDSIPALTAGLWFRVLEHFEIEPISIWFKDGNFSWRRSYHEEVRGVMGCDDPAPATAGRCVHVDSVRESYDDSVGGFPSNPCPWWCASDGLLNYCGYRVFMHQATLHRERYMLPMAPEKYVPLRWRDDPDAWFASENYAVLQRRRHISEPATKRAWWRRW